MPTNANITEKPARPVDPGAAPKPLDVVPIAVPPAEQQRRRDAAFVEAGGKRDRYSLPDSLESTSPVGYRTRVAVSRADAELLMALLTLARPSAFVRGPAISEQELF